MFDTTHYNDVSLEAAALERQGKYQQAAAHWDKAGPLAKKEKNRNWSQARKEFCSSLYATEHPSMLSGSSRL